MASTIKLVIDLEDPCGDIQVLSYELGQTVDELLFIVYIYLANRGRHVSQLEDLLRSRLR